MNGGRITDPKALEDVNRPEPFHPRLCYTYISEYLQVKSKRGGERQFLCQINQAVPSAHDYGNYNKGASGQSFWDVLIFLIG